MARKPAPGTRFTQFQTIAPDFLERALGDLVAREGGGPDGWAEALSRFLYLLVDWNDRVNLVSRKSIDEVVEGQLRLSLAALRIVPPGRELRVLDVGTGGGFPGIPVAILRPLAHVALVEATQKKCAFLEEAARQIPLPNVTVHASRIEAPTHALVAAAPFDVAVARAVGNPEQLPGAVLPLLRRGAEFWTFVAPSQPDAIPWPSAEDPRTALRCVARR